MNSFQLHLWLWVISVPIILYGEVTKSKLSKMYYLFIFSPRRYSGSSVCLANIGLTIWIPGARNPTLKTPNVGYQVWMSQDLRNDLNKICGCDTLGMCYQPQMCLLVWSKPDSHDIYMDWLIDFIVFYAVSTIFRPYNFGYSYGCIRR